MSESSTYNSDEDIDLQELSERRDFSRRGSVDSSVTFRAKSTQNQIPSIVEITETGTFEDISEDDEETLGPMTDSETGLIPNTKKVKSHLKTCFNNL
jgi:hypothetical protein